jgi:hypothetical protein
MGYDSRSGNTLLVQNSRSTAIRLPISGSSQTNGGSFNRVSPEEYQINENVYTEDEGKTQGEDNSRRTSQCIKELPSDTPRR